MKFNLAAGYTALIVSSIQVDQASHHIAGSLAHGKRLILCAKEPAQIGVELILGQFGGVLAQDVDIGSQVIICQADMLMVSRAPAILPVLEVETRRMAMEYWLAFSARPAKIRLQLATKQLSCLL
jgi:hypothetical protein